MKKSERGDWRRAKNIAYFSDLKINRTDDLEYAYTVKHLMQLYSDYRACTSLIKKEEEDLLADKEEYINAIAELKDIVDYNISENEDNDLWIKLKQILEKENQQQNIDSTDNQTEQDNAPQKK